MASHHDNSEEEQAFEHIDWEQCDEQQSLSNLATHFDTRYTHKTSELSTEQQPTTDDDVQSFEELQAAVFDPILSPPQWLDETGDNHFNTSLSDLHSTSITAFDQLPILQQETAGYYIGERAASHAPHFKVFTPEGATLDITDELNQDYETSCNVPEASKQQHDAVASNSNSPPHTPVRKAHGCRTESVASITPSSSYTGDGSTVYDDATPSTQPLTPQTSLTTSLPRSNSVGNRNMGVVAEKSATTPFTPTRSLTSFAPPSPTPKPSGSAYICIKTSCKRFGEAFDTKSDLGHHELSHMPHNKRRHACPLCARGFHYPKDVRRHMKIHKGNKVICPVCRKRLSRDDNLSRHIATQHNDMQPGLDLAAMSTLSPSSASGTSIAPTAYSDSVAGMSAPSSPLLSVQAASLSFQERLELSTLEECDLDAVGSEDDAPLAAPPMLKSHSNFT